MGGNIWVNSSPIKYEHVVPTFIKYLEEIKLYVGDNIIQEIYSNIIFVGSTGKQRLSGDIDLCINIKALYPLNNRSLSEYGITESDYDRTLSKLVKRARTASKQDLELKAFMKEFAKVINQGNILIDEKKIDYNSMFSQFDQYQHDGELLNEKVQIDWIFADDMDWASFAYHSSLNSNYKGLHRTQLLLSILGNINYGFSHSYGFFIKNQKDTTKSTSLVRLVELINEQYDIDIELGDLDSFESIHDIIYELYEYSNILDIYLPILDKTRTEIPTILHQYYKDNKERLNLTGKFLTKPIV